MRITVCGNCGFETVDDYFDEVMREKDKQIADLKEIAISLYVKSMEECNGECGKNEWKPETCDDCEHEYARKQLEAEYEAMR